MANQDIAQLYTSKQYDMDNIFGRIKAKRELSPEVYGMLDDYSKRVEASQEIADVLRTGEATDTVVFSDKPVAPIDYNKPFNISDIGLEVKPKEVGAIGTTFNALAGIPKAGVSIVADSANALAGTLGGAVTEDFGSLTDKVYNDPKDEVLNRLYSDYSNRTGAFSKDSSIKDFYNQANKQGIEGADAAHYLEYFADNSRRLIKPAREVLQGTLSEDEYYKQAKDAGFSDFDAAQRLMRLKAGRAITGTADFATDEIKDNITFGHDPSIVTSMKDVREAEGVGKLTKTAKLIAEQGPQQLANLYLLAKSPKLMATSVWGNVAEENAQNSGEYELTAENLANSSWAATLSYALDKTGLKALNKGKGMVGGVSAGAIEAATEGTQEGIEYFGGLTRTGKEVNTQELTDRVATGAIVGGAVGTVFNAAGQYSDRDRTPKEPIEQPTVVEQTEQATAVQPNNPLVDQSTDSTIIPTNSNQVITGMYSPEQIVALDDIDPKLAKNIANLQGTLANPNITPEQKAQVESLLQATINNNDVIGKIGMPRKSTPIQQPKVIDQVDLSSPPQVQPNTFVTEEVTPEQQREEIIKRKELLDNQLAEADEKIRINQTPVSTGVDNTEVQTQNLVTNQTAQNDNVLADTAIETTVPTSETKPISTEELVGKQSKVRTMDKNLSTRFKVVEADSLSPVVSNDIDLGNDETSNIEQAEYDSPSLDNMPMVAKDGSSIMKGNQRTQAIKNEYQEGKGGDYRSELLASAEQYGIDPNEVAKMRFPVVVRQLENDTGVDEQILAPEPSNDILYSKSEPNNNTPSTNQNPDSARTAIEKALGKTVADSINIQTNSGSDMVGVEGYHNRTTGETVVLLDNIEPVYDVDGNVVMTREERAVWVAWHESYHKGTSVAGSTQYRKTLALAGRNPFIKALAEKIQQENPDYTLEVAIEEALAELSAGLSTDRLDVIAKQYGIAAPEYDGIKALVNNWLNAIRNIVRKLTGKELIISDAQIADLVNSVGELAINDAVNSQNLKQKPINDEVNPDIESEEAYLEKMFSFAGKKSKDADKMTLKQAVELDKQGKTNEQIRRATGWFEGVDGQWRYEIDDSQAKTSYLFEYILKRDDEVAVELHELLNHNDLYRAYPHLSNMVIQIVEMEDNQYGSYAPTMQRININNSLSVEDAKSTLLHEIQHAIQEFEGFATGTNSEVARDLLENKYGSEADLEASIAKKEKTIANLDNKIRINSNKLMSLNLYESAVKLKDYGLKDKPSSVWRHIRSHIGTYHNYHLATVDDRYKVSKTNHERVRKAYRDIQGLPRRNSSYKFNAELSDAILELSTAFEKAIPKAELKKIKEDGKAYYKYLLNQRNDLVKKRITLKQKVNAMQGVYVNYNTDDYNVYKNTAGEAEARLVQQRLDLDKKGREDTPIKYDVPVENQIVVTPSEVNNYYANKNTENSTSESHEVFSLDESNNSKFSKAVDELKETGEISHEKRFLTLGTTPDVLKMIGVPDTKITLQKSIISKVTIGKHSLTFSDVKRIPKEINNPIAVIKSRTVDGGYVVFTELTEMNKGAEQPVIVALHIKTTSNGTEVVNIKSAYGRRDSQLENDLKNVVYWNTKKGYSFVRRRGLQLPISLANMNNLSANDIKTEKDLSQYKLSKSQSDEQSEIDAVREKYEGTDQWLKAPNGDDTNLTEKQWLQVRTPNFKQWFGDWENDPDNASKVLDENGEPKVMYHQTDATWTIYDNSKAKAGKYDSETPLGLFTKSTNDDIGVGDNKNQYQLYVNIKNPLIFENREEARNWYIKNIDGYEQAANEQEQNDIKYDALFNKAQNDAKAITSELRKNRSSMTDKEFKSGIDKSFKPSRDILDQWKNENNKLYLKAKGLIDSYLKDSGYDGVVLKVDEGSFGRETDSTISINPNQIKSATDNNGDFSSDNDNVYFSRAPKRPLTTLVPKKTRLREEVKAVLNDQGLEASIELLKEKDKVANKFLNGKLIEAWNEWYSNTESGKTFNDRLFDAMGELDRLSKKFGGLAKNMHDKFRMVNAKIQEELRVNVEPAMEKLSVKLADKFKELRELEAYSEYTEKYGKAQFLHDLDQIGKYVKHGKERNLQVMINTQGEQLDGSGKGNAEIDVLIAYYNQRPELIEFYEQIYKDDIRPMIEYRSNQLIEAGILTDEMIAGQYDWDWYVPLKGKGSEAQYDPITDELITDGVTDTVINNALREGKGFRGNTQIKRLNNNEIKKMEGRHGTEADSIFGTIFTDAQSAVQRNKMREAKKALLDYASTSEGVKVLDAKVVKLVKINKFSINESGQLIINKYFTKSGKDEVKKRKPKKIPEQVTITKQLEIGADGKKRFTKNELTEDKNTVVYQDGNDVYMIRVGNPRAMKAMSFVSHSFGDGLGSNLFRGANKLTRLNSSVWTRFSPSFQIMNKLRDAFQHYILVLADSPVTTKGNDYKEAWGNLGIRLKAANMAAKNNIRYTGSLGTAISGEGNATYQEYKKYLDILRKEGGVTTYSQLLGSDTLKSIEREFTKNVADNDSMHKRATDKAVAFFDGVNDHIELTSRVALFKALMDSGVSQSDAALYVKNTMNFETKGENGKLMGAFYAFSTAIIYDSKRTASAIFTNKEGHIVFAMLVIAKLMEMGLADLLGEDDEDGISYIDKQPFYQAMGYTNYVFGERGEGIKIPKGWGVSRVASGVAVIGRRVANGRMSPLEAVDKMAFDIIMGNFSPMQIKAMDADIEDRIAQTLAPTVGVPLVQLATNTSFSGSLVYPNPTFKKDDHLEYESGYGWTEDTYKAIAKILYRTTGRDFYPETIKLMTRSYVPMATEMMQVTEAMIDGMQGNSDTTQIGGKIPFVSKFNSFPPRYEQRLYRKREEVIKNSFAKMSEAKRSGNDGRYQKFKDQDIDKWIKRTKILDKSMRNLRKKSDVYKKQYEGEELIQRLRKVEDEEKRLLIKFNRMYEKEFDK